MVSFVPSKNVDSTELTAIWTPRHNKYEKCHIKYTSSSLQRMAPRQEEERVTFEIYRTEDIDRDAT
jgi:hypothetical protein